MNPKILSIALAMAVTAAMAARAQGQVGQIQGGNKLDTTMRVVGDGMTGGGANNSINSQLFITGQTSGLSSFHGTLPYTPSNQLQMNLPSASLSNFQRQSVGLKDVLSGSTYAPAPYFDPSKTVVNAGGIAARLNLPGTNVPASTRIDTSIASKQYIDATAQYQSVLPNPGGRTLSVPLQSPPPSYLKPENATPTNTNLGPAAPDTTAATQPPPGISAKPAPGVLLGLLRAKDRDKLGQELAQLEQRDLPLDASVKANLDPTLMKDPNFSPLVKEPNALRLGVDERLRSIAPSATPGMQTNQDVFLDVLQRLSERREKGNVRIKPGGGKIEEDEPGSRPARRNRVELSKDSQVIIHNLEGTGNDAVNRALADAQARLLEGKYYEAVDLYQIVVTYSPQNPLPRLGLSLAYFGAGEPVSAAIEIRKAIETFPPIMETRLDIPNMVPMKDFTPQRTALERKLTEFKYEKNDPLLLFLACYLDYNAGSAEQAMRYARAIQAEAPQEDKLLQAYAKFVLTGERPQAATTFPSLMNSATTAPAE